MRLAFLTGCLEPGRSGVGDYVRRLAGACVQRGHQVLLIAVNDPHVGIGCGTEGNPSSWRVASTEFADNDMSAAVRGFETFCPDWVSLQFVPYAFDPKGLVLRKSGNLLRFLRERKVHMMCHELWIGEHKGAGLKSKVVGSFQKWMVRRFLAAARPRVLHAGSGLYRELLAGIGFHAELLPIFSNIPDEGGNCRGWLLAQTRGRGSGGDTQAAGGNIWMTGIFGTLHHDVCYDRIMEGIVRAASENGRVPVCFSFGNVGQGDAIWRNLGEKFSDRMEFVTLGPQPPPRISQILNSLDLGISASPWDVASKSGTVAAMIEHGLPVVASDDTNRYLRRVRDESLVVSPLVKSVDAYLSEGLHLSPQPRTKINRLALVVDVFLQSLATSGNDRSMTGDLHRAPKGALC